MNNLKIKTYSLKKNQAGSLFPASLFANDKLNNNMSVERKNSKETVKVNQQSISKSKEKEKEKEKEITNKYENQHQHQNSLLNEINKIIKTPALNISSKLDSKGNRSININFFDKQVNDTIDHKNSKSSKMSELGGHNEKKSVETRSPENEKDREKNINIKLNINSEVINNNINIKNRNETSCLPTSTNNNKENIGNLNKLKGAVLYYKELVAEKDKRIELLSSELNKLKDVLNLYESNNNTTLQLINSPKSITQNSPMAGSKLDLRTKGRNNIDKFDRETFLGNEILSERLKTNKLNTKNDSSGIGIFSGISNPNFKEGKKLNSTISGFLNKGKSNPGRISNKHTKSFFGQSGVSDTHNTINSQHTALDIFNPQTKKDLEPIDRILKSTISKLNDIKSGSLEEQILSYPSSKVNSYKININSDHLNEDAGSKLNGLKNRTEKILDFYYDRILSKISHN